MGVDLLGRLCQHTAPRPLDLGVVVATHGVSLCDPDVLLVLGEG